MRRLVLLLTVSLLLVVGFLSPLPRKNDFVTIIVNPKTGELLEELHQSVLLDNVPILDWCYGCSPTTATMLFGYYDRHNYNNIYLGLTNDGLFPLTNSTWGVGECPLAASHKGIDNRLSNGHVDDYWVAFRNKDNDPCIANCHSDDSLADFMGTSQDRYNNSDGATTFYAYFDGRPLYDYVDSEPSRRDGCHGMRLFAESRGYLVVTNYTQKIVGVSGVDHSLGFTYEQYVNEINNGYPVVIQLEGHTVLGIGYTGTSIIYILNTWDHSIHTMTWGGLYSGMLHYAVTVIHLSKSEATTVTVIIKY